MKRLLLIKVSKLYLLFIIICSLHLSCSKRLNHQFDKYTEEATYIFEGEILTVNLFPCDENGNKISTKNVVWKNGYGQFQLEDGTTPLGYSETTVKVTKVLKGSINTDTIVIESFTENLHVYLRKKDGNIIIEYNYFPPSHDADPIILPRNSIGKKHIFYCKKPFSALEKRVSLCIYK